MVDFGRHGNCKCVNNTTMLNDDNFLLYAIKHYNNPSCIGMKEFQDDIKRFKYIKRLLRKYKKTGELAEKLLLNHIILLYNVFGSFVVPSIFFKIENEHWPQIKTFIVYLHYLPEGYIVDGIYNESEIPLDDTIINKLRKL
jgi:hypothetical protein